MSGVEVPLLRRTALAALLGICGFSSAAQAGPSDVRLYRSGEPAAAPEAKPSTFSDSDLLRFRERLDVALGEAIEDLGLDLDTSEPRALPGRASQEDELVERAQSSWAIVPELSASGSRLRLRLTAVRPGSKVLLTRSLEIAPAELEMRAALMMRDLVQAGQPRPIVEQSEPIAGALPAPVAEPRSSGRAVLALNAAALGGYVGFSIQRASGSEDERLTYPLIALGAGVGLGGSMLIADEWDISAGDAWFLSAGIWWPVGSGLALARSYEVKEEERYLYGLLGASAGLTLGSVAVAMAGMSEGDAVLAHSGGAFGLALGGMTELMIEGRTNHSPLRGMGYGTAIGVLAAGALATQVDATPSRVLLIDLAASLGALTGAAAGSPLLLVEEEQTKARTRLWLGSIGLGTVLGGALGWWMTRGSSEPAGERKAASVVPYVGVVPERGPKEPTFVDLGVRGTF